MMELLHHEVKQREEDGQMVCRRCGMLNPSEDQPCIPMNMEPTEPDSAD